MLSERTASKEYCAALAGPAYSSMLMHNCLLSKFLQGHLFFIAVKDKAKARLTYPIGLPGRFKFNELGQLVQASLLSATAVRMATRGATAINE